MSDLFQRIAAQYDKRIFLTLNEEMSFAEYLEEVYENPKIIRTAYQRIYDMIMSEGTETFKKFRKTYVHYKFFDKAEVPIYGLEETLENLVKFIRGAAGGYGTERRVLLLHGPVGSAKSTICRLIKRGMERYSRTGDGKWYSFKWVNLPTGLEGIYTHTEDEDPMFDEPLKLIPQDVRKIVLEELNERLRELVEKEIDLYTLKCEGELNPRSKKFMNELLKKYDGDWKEVVNNHIRVVRKVYSEADRTGIATFQPKDEKNQDATELTGDINYAKLPHFGSDSDPRAFNFDGEFCVGNRGVVEFIEMLKLAQEFLYDLLGASQEQQIKPKKYPQIDVDLAIFGHTNHPEYEKLRGNQSMEALRDRTVKIDVPYLLEWSKEQSILHKYYGPDKVRQHIAPHTLEIAALWAILTRLEDDKENKLTVVQKAKLYDGRALPGYTEDTVKELRAKHENEGMVGGVSCRYVQDKISNCLSNRNDYINPFMVLNELKDGLAHSSLLTNKDEISKYRACIDLAKKELDEILKKEVQQAIVGNKEAIIRLCSNYIDNVTAYINNTKILNPYTGQEQLPDEKLMRSIEEKIDIPDSGADEFRRSMAVFIGTLATEKKQFTWDSNPKLREALEAKLFEDTKDHINLSKLNVKDASVVDPDIQEKIDLIKQRLIEMFGYNDQSATDVMDYISSIFARGDISEDD